MAKFTQMKKMSETDQNLNNMKQSIWKRIDFTQKAKDDYELYIANLIGEKDSEEKTRMLIYYRKRFYEANGALDVLYDICRNELDE